MDLARDEFGRPKKLFLSGASAGGVGTATWAPLIARFVFGNKPKIKNFNDAGPVAALLIPIPPIVAAIEARAADWQFEQFYPESCTECSPFNQATEIVKWRLDRFYTVTANGVPLHEWTADFLHGRRGRPGWTDIVEDFVPAP
ncbi:MAG: hypothetical protein OSB70_14710 [Myxococcota bacterium]|nr:hypothetical protein [Myxococcota bacterium]